MGIGSSLVYRGPGAASGEIINVVLTISSANRKIGAAAQVWIVPHADHLRLKDSEYGPANDAAVCGTCPLRADGPAGRMCYVNPLTAGSVTKAAYRKETVEDLPDSLRGLALGLRIGAYGDPGELPVWLLEALVALSATASGGGAARQGKSKQVGYTQHWRRLGANPPHAKYLMASCFSLAEAAHAASLGWRFYLVTDSDTEVVDADQDLGRNIVACPNYTHGTSCMDCMMCDGVGENGAGAKRPSIYHPAHGAGVGQSEATVKRKMARLRDGLPVLA